MTETLIITVEVPEIGIVPASPTVEISPSTIAPPVILLATPGARGTQGPPGTSTPVFGESPSGAIDGMNQTFTVAHPYIAGSTGLYLNGLREYPGDAYTETGGQTIHFIDAPLPGDTIRVDYLLQ
jgi:hypothetical protein